jgi:hypothetical protein
MLYVCAVCLSVVLTRHTKCKMHITITVLIIFLQLINNNFYVTRSFRKLQITIPGNCLYCFSRVDLGRLKVFSWKQLQCCVNVWTDSCNRYKMVGVYYWRHIWQACNFITTTMLTLKRFPNNEHAVSVTVGYYIFNSVCCITTHSSPQFQYPVHQAVTQCSRQHVPCPAPHTPITFTTQP